MFTISAFPTKSGVLERTQPYEDIEDEFMEDSVEDFENPSGSYGRLTSPGVSLTSSDAFMR